MLKRFFISMLGAIAGFWIALLLAGIVLITVVGLAATGLFSGKTAAQITDNSILYIDLATTITDRPSNPDLSAILSKGSPEASLPLDEAVAALEAAASDKRIRGLYIQAGGVTSGLASAQALAKAIDRFKESGKWVYAYGDNYSQTDYFIACRADSLWLNPIGSVDLHGLASQTPYFSTLLDRLGIEMQVVKVGTYKSAVEPYILTGPSEANTEQTELFLSQLWSGMRTAIAQSRGLKPERVDQLADSLLAYAPAEAMTSLRLADGLRYRHQVEDMLCQASDVDNLDDLNYITPSEYCTAASLPATSGHHTTIAVLYAVGDISDNGTDGIIGDDMVDQILDLADDDDIDALVMRVNSPGGSAFASEQIWEALQQFKEITGKPFYVSMGDYAASGGYYISCGADRIYAEPLTLTGSIGVFGLIPDVKKGLNDILGVNMATIATNPDAAFPTIFEPMTERQRASMQAHVNRCYDLFTARVAQGRSMPQDSVKAIAEGRVWDGATALSLGLVDRLGGLDQALRDMAEQLGTTYDNCDIVAYPDLDLKWWSALLDLSQARVHDWAVGRSSLSPQALNLYRSVSGLQGIRGPQARMLPIEIH